MGKRNFSEDFKRDAAIRSGRRPLVDIIARTFDAGLYPTAIFVTVHILFLRGFCKNLWRIGASVVMSQGGTLRQ
jgi:hypothetical protein